MGSSGAETGLARLTTLCIFNSLLAIEMNKEYKRDWARKKRGWIPPSPRPCVVCGNDFTPSVWHPKSKTCSRRCSRKAEYREHAAAYVARAAIYTKNHPEMHARCRKNWIANNITRYRHIKLIIQHRRIARLRRVGGIGVTKQNWLSVIESQRGMCWWCAQEKPLHMDHVIPISKGGEHSPNNIIGACHSCNSRKRNRIWPIENGKLFEMVAVWKAAGLVTV